MKKTMLAVLVVVLSGCSGVGFSTEIYRIDKKDSSMEMKDKPWRCLWTECAENGTVKKAGL